MGTLLVLSEAYFISINVLSTHSDYSFGRMEYSPYFPFLKVNPFILGCCFGQLKQVCHEALSLSWQLPVSWEREYIEFWRSWLNRRQEMGGSWKCFLEAGGYISWPLFIWMCLSWVAAMSSVPICFGYFYSFLWKHPTESVLRAVYKLHSFN